MPPLSRAVIETLVKEHRVVLFSKTWCPFCNKVKELLNSKFIPYHKIELDKELTQISNLWKSSDSPKNTTNIYILGSNFEYLSASWRRTISNIIVRVLWSNNCSKCLYWRATYWRLWWYIEIARRWKTYAIRNKIN